MRLTIFVLSLDDDLCWQVGCPLSVVRGHQVVCLHLGRHKFRPMLLKLDRNNYNSTESRPLSANMDKFGPNTRSLGHVLQAI